MARSGLTKSQVREARDRLLAAGRHPSVDALRERERELAELRSTVATLTARVRQLETEAQFGVDDTPLRHWHDRQRAAGGFGHFDSSLLNSRSSLPDASPFDMIRAAARS